ncbi:MFS transporter [Micromonospora sp. M71_S20]|uniref:MFS transporter n=1 Tax=Micromonospora sp. M71_S20 TaxID=592872 RepID=UPI000EAEA420
MTLKKNFRLLWTAETVSQFGFEVATVVIPLFAVKTLHATPAQVGFLVTCEFLGFLLIGLPAGAWIDRRRGERVLVLSSLGRTAVFGVVAALALAGDLTMPTLYALMFAGSLCTVFLGISYQSVLPRIVDRQLLPGANSRVEFTLSLAEITGPAIAGFLLALATSSYVLGASAVCFGIATLLLSRIRVTGATAAPPPRTTTLFKDVRDGIRYVLRVPMFRVMAIRSSTYNFCNIATTTMFLLLLASVLRLPSAYIGIIFSGAGAGATLGALLAVRLSRRFGVGPTVLGACVLAGIASIPLPFARSGTWLIVAAIGYGIASGCIVVSNILQLSVRQALCAPGMQARLSATMRFLVWGVIPLGASVAGLVANVIGVRQTLALAVAGELVSIVPLYFSPLRRVVEMPTEPEPEPAPEPQPERAAGDGARPEARQLSD